jgi:anti-anti-sigma regulatory factor
LLTSRLLAEASPQQARLVILDIAGVTTIGTAVARGLLITSKALRLLGCVFTLSGVSAAGALTLVSLGVGTEDMDTARSLREALATCKQRPRVVSFLTIVAMR